MKLYNTKNQEIPLKRLVKDQVYYFEDTYDRIGKHNPQTQEEDRFNAIVAYEGMVIEFETGLGMEVASFRALSLSSTDEHLKIGCLIYRGLDDSDIIIKELED